jgi:hypothetical protein
MHGGAMRIRSKLGTGTMVVVRLPIEAKLQARVEKTEATTVVPALEPQGALV